jgi:hypothetical protein
VLDLTPTWSRRWWLSNFSLVSIKRSKIFKYRGQFPPYVSWLCGSDEMSIYSYVTYWSVRIFIKLTFSALGNCRLKPTSFIVMIYLYLPQIYLTFPWHLICWNNLYDVKNVFQYSINTSDIHCKTNCIPNFECFSNLRCKLIGIFSEKSVKTYMSIYRNVCCFICLQHLAFLGVLYAKSCLIHCSPINVLRWL